MKKIVVILVIIIGIIGFIWETNPYRAYSAYDDKYDTKIVQLAWDDNYEQEPRSENITIRRYYFIKEGYKTGNARVDDKGVILDLQKTSVNDNKYKTILLSKKVYEIVFVKYFIEIWIIEGCPNLDKETLSTMEPDPNWNK